MKQQTLLILALLLSNFLYAQSPESFKYQAQIRDKNGNILAKQNISLKISIVQSSPSGSIVYSEEHAIQTNSNGIITIAIGEGDQPTANFSTIDWGTDSYYVKTELDPEGGTNYTEMGTSQLLSVPYALYSKNSGKVNQYNSDTLFVVKDNQGNVVFAVFPDGAKVYVNDTSPKDKAGGFAVTGRSKVKGTEFSIFHATPDSTRIYINDSTTTKDKAGGFAVSGRSKVKGEENRLFYADNDSTRIYIYDSAKDKAGGFAVSGRNNSKAGDFRLMQLTPENYTIGHSAGTNITTGYKNFFAGYEAGMENTTGFYNVFLGYRAGKNNNSSSNVFIGTEAGINNVDGWSNVFIGNRAGYNNIGGGGTFGARNVFIGREAGYYNEDGGDNIYIGAFAGNEMVSGDNNVIIGNTAASHNTTGQNNVYFGNRAAYSNNGNSNVIIGNLAGSNSQEYSPNSNYSTSVMIGEGAGYSNVDGTGNVFLGYRAGYSESGSDKLYIENTTANSTNALIYGEFDNDKLRFNANVGVGYPAYSLYGMVVLGGTSNSLRVYEASGQTYSIYTDGTVHATNYASKSDLRQKQNINTYNNALNKILKLRGVSFNWKSTKNNTDNKKHIGLIAQEVEKIIPELITEDEKGNKAITYSGMVPVMIEAMKEQQKIIKKLREELELQQDKNEELKQKIDKIFEMMKNK
jgi:hypothetical protein